MTNKEKKKNISLLICSDQRWFETLLIVRLDVRTFAQLFITNIPVIIRVVNIELDVVFNFVWV